MVDVKMIQMYAKRNATLKAMGYSSYDAYLRGDEWAMIRDYVLRRNKKCSLCGGEATQVHHGDYDEASLRGRKRGSLYPICGVCHGFIEFCDHTGRKLDPCESTTKLRRTLFNMKNGLKERNKAEARIAHQQAAARRAERKKRHELLTAHQQEAKKKKREDREAYEAYMRSTREERRMLAKSRPPRPSVPSLPKGRTSGPPIDLRGRRGRPTESPATAV